MGALGPATPRYFTPHGPIQVLELLQLCRARMAALVPGGELAPTVSLSQLQASSGHSLCGSLFWMQLVLADR